MSLLDLRTVRVLTTICAFAAIAAFVYGVRHTLVLIIFAVFFAYLLEPLVLRIENTRLGCHRRSVAILVTYVLCGGVLATLLVIFGGKLAEDARKFTQGLPLLLQNLTSGKIVWQLGSSHGWSYETQVRMEQFIAGHREVILSWVQQVGTSVASSLTNILWIVLIPILAIFFLLSGRDIANWITENFGRGHQRLFLEGIAEDLDAMLASFIGAQLILAGISLVIYSSFFTIMRLPYALVLGVAAGFMEFIPVVGPLVAAGAILGVGFLSAYPHLLVVAIFLGCWRVLQDYVISPRVMGGKVELPPLAAITAVLMGGELGGVLGVYLSIPVAATIRIVWVRWQRYRRNLAVIEPAETRDRPVAVIGSR